MYPYRPDGHQNNLRSSAYESLMEIVKNSAKDCYPAVQKTTLVIMERLQQVLQMEVRPGSVVSWGRWGYFVAALGIALGSDNSQEACSLLPALLAPAFC